MHVLDMLSEADMIECKAVDTLIDPNFKLLSDQGSSWKNQGIRD